MESRIGYDWSKHELEVSRTENAVVYKFKKPNSIQGAVYFINSYGIMAVTGDWGNWIFCREFHPGADERVSDGYWCEKLRIASTQQEKNFSPEKTKEEINERLIDEDLEGEERAYLRELLEKIDDYSAQDGESYRQYAFENIPNGYDYEVVPFQEENKFWLKAIFDAFDEICSRMVKREEPAVAKQ